MAFTILVPSFTGILNGYIKKEGGLSPVEKRTILGISAIFGGVRGLSRLRTMNLQMSITPGQGLAALFLGIPFVVGSSYCTGHHFGKTFRHIDEIRSTIRGPSR
jgi:hypothetical protein